MSSNVSFNITRSALLTILSQLPAHVFGLITGVFIARMLGPEGRGEYAIFFANNTLLCTIFGFSVINSIVYFTANAKIKVENLKSIIAFLSGITVVVSAALVVVWIMSPLKSLFLSSELLNVRLVIYFVLIILFVHLNSVFTAYYQGLRHFKIVNTVLILNGVYSMLIYGALYLLHTYKFRVVDLNDVALWYLVILALNTIHWMLYYFKTGRIAWSKWDDFKLELRYFLQFTAMNHLSNSLIFLNHRLILWFLAFYLDNWNIGIFSIGVGLAQLLYLFSNPLSLVLESFLSARVGESQDQLFSRFARIQFTAVFLICAAAFCLSRLMVPIIYGHNYIDSVAVLKIVLIGILMSCQSNVISSYYLATNQTKYNALAAFFGVLMTIASAPFLIQNYGFYGAAITQVLAYAVSFLIQFIIIRKRTKVDVNLFLVTKSDWQFVKKQLKKV